MNSVFLTAVILASLSKGEVRVEHPEVAFKASAIFGKPSTPTPTGIYLLEKAYSTYLKQNILIFRRENNTIYAIHSNLKSRTNQLATKQSTDNFLSGGCIGLAQKDFDKLWATKQQLILQVY